MKQIIVAARQDLEEAYAAAGTSKARRSIGRAYNQLGEVLDLLHKEDADRDRWLEATS